ncbi:MAG: hypothetical protein ACK50A_00075 [Sphingobacteriaceae bacterium]|jgi:hypothetical protein
MEKFILQRKQLSLKKNKEFTLAIPVNINPRTANFIIEAAIEPDPNKPAIVQFHFKKLHKDPESQNLLKKEVILTGSITQFNYRENIDPTSEYILVGGIANIDLTVALTVIEG